MTSPYGGDLLSFGGKVIVHDSKAELEFLVCGVRIVECPRDIPDEQTIPLRFHPDMATIRWPLTKEQFL
ncbi:hypothetical protein [Streptomyces griseoaurantiacus]|uniref:Uncharacterized protein n=1 Tax=Streptomyces griseoaurantiacus TaxID=68213 RepID=A0A7W2DSL6_9ACTN|nr:hypothetical protein [Streptomyces griseoaurantiacus]MBA5222222.1 hypothetical protein [Streptomyces griseoaurantiacus]